MQKIITTTILCALTLPTLPAFAQSRAQCPNYPQSERMSVHKVQQQLLRQGYVIHEFDDEHHCLEAEVMDQKGRRSKLYMDAKSGKVIHTVHKNKDHQARRDSKSKHWW